MILPAGLTSHPGANGDWLTDGIDAGTARAASDGIHQVLEANDIWHAAVEDYPSIDAY